MHSQDNFLAPGPLAWRLGRTRAYPCSAASGVARPPLGPLIWSSRSQTTAGSRRSVERTGRKKTTERPVRLLYVSHPEATLQRRKITAANSGLGSVAPILLAEASANQEDPQRLGHAGWVTRRDVAGTTRHAPPDAENPQRGFRCSRAWALAGCRRLPGSKRRFQCRCRRDPSGCRLGEANQDAVFQRVIMGRGEGGPRIEAHGPAARKEAMACVSALPIDRRRPYRRRRLGARIQPG